MSKSINLLPDPILATQREISRFYQGTSIVVIILILFALLNLVMLFFSIQTNKNLEDLLAQEDAAKVEIKELRPIELKLFQLRDKLFRYNRFKRDSLYLEVIWDNLQSAAQGTVTMENVTVNQDKLLEVKAKTSSLAKAVEYLLELKNTDELSRFRVSAISFDSGDRTYIFTTVFDLVPETNT